MKSDIRPLIPVLISACLLLMLSFGYRAGFGLFVRPMSEAHEWGRDVMSMALAIQNLTWGVVAVFAGGIADKYGNLRVLLVGAVCYALGMVGMAYASTETAIIATAGLLVGSGISGTAFGIVLPALARAVPADRRSWAMGVGTSAGSFGQFLIVPMMAGVIDATGWFMALNILGASALLMAVVAIPLAPYGGPHPHKEDQTDGVPLVQIFKRAWSIRSYRLLILGFYVCGFHLAFITVHMPGYLVDLGFDAKIGAWSISIIGLFNVIGAYIAGVLSDKHSKSRILSLIYFLRAVAITLFLVIPVSLVSVLMFSAAMGFLWLATVPPTSGLVAVFFGTRYMAFLYGIVFLSHQVGSFSGVWLGGYLFERYQTYDGVWIIGIILGLLAAWVHIPIQERSEESVLLDQPA